MHFIVQHWKISALKWWSSLTCVLRRQISHRMRFVQHMERDIDASSVDSVDPLMTMRSRVSNSWPETKCYQPGHPSKMEIWLYIWASNNFVTIIIMWCNPSKRIIHHFIAFCRVEWWRVEENELTLSHILKLPEENSNLFTKHPTWLKFIPASFA